MQVCFFEDRLAANFHPLTLTRPVDDLRLGILTIAEKWHHALGHAPWSRVARANLQSIFDHSALDKSKSTVWINSRFLPSDALVEKVSHLAKGTCIKNDETVIAAHADPSTFSAWLSKGEPDFSSMLVLEGHDFRSINHLWDLFLMNGQEITNDIKRLGDPYSNDNEVSPEAILKGDDHIFIEDGAVIEPGAIIMAGSGSVYIGDGASVMAGAMIRGPVAICKGATVKMGAKIYPGTTIGPVCKAGGEVNNSILHSYSNKAHDGFLGNSIVGQWCNLGADTNTSNLKNNYGSIRATDWQRREEIETGQQFLGTIMGDHTKTAINTQLNTGTVCGISCNIFADDFPPKLIPSFSWVGSNVIQPYKIEKALEAMEAMMARRDVAMTDNYKQMMRQIFEQSQRAAH